MPAKWLVIVVFADGNAGASATMGDNGIDSRFLTTHDSSHETHRQIGPRRRRPRFRLLRSSRFVPADVADDEHGIPEVRRFRRGDKALAEGTQKSGASCRRNFIFEVPIRWGSDHSRPQQTCAFGLRADHANSASSVGVDFHLAPRPVVSLPRQPGLLSKRLVPTQKACRQRSIKRATNI